MALVLKIENETSLPDGGPLSVTVQGTRGIDIGRDQYLDWTLPDPSRFISGKHCEIRWHDGAYWLHDVSTNGTFLYGADGRLKEPHKLRDGDRFSIGHYIVVAAVSGESSSAIAEAPASNAPPGYDKLWDPVGEAAPPIDPKQLKAARDLQPVKPDFLDWAIDVPHSYPPSQPEPLRGDVPKVAVDDWAQGMPKQAPAQPQPEITPVPSPRRPTWVTEPDGPWASAASPAGVSTAPASSLSQTRERSGRIADGPSMAEFVRLIARGAGLPEEAFAARDPAELATEMGQMMRLVTENMKQLLDARQQAKRLTRSASQTTVQALDNNPLKFAPNVEDAMRIMFAPPTKSYLDARSAFTQGFGDLKTHQVKTFAAMQQALKQLLEEFDPATLEKVSTGDRGLAVLVGSRKARLWDAYVARWQARTQTHQEGMLNAFMDYFAKCYDRDQNGV